MRKTVLAALLVLLAASRVTAQADLKQYVALIEAQYYEETRQMFQSLAVHFSDQGNTDLAGFFNAYAQGGGFGSGWVHVTPDGANYIITNQHVVSQAGSVTIRFEQPDGSFLSYPDAPIVYVDDNMDLAVVQFPNGARVFENGFPIDTALKPDGTELFSAGFPGFGGEPLWQFSSGIVTNSRARPSVFPGYDYLIQHSAQIDPGNSGGPLMVRDSSSPTGFAVVGVNTWKATQRNNTNFSIPAKELPGLLERAAGAVATRADPEALTEQLRSRATVLAAELSSANPDFDQIHRFISYALVGRRGWDAFSELLGQADDPATWEQEFFNDPIETMRTSLYYQFWVSLGDTRRVEFTGINPADLERIATIDEIRTTYTVGGSVNEIVWGWEYGTWKIRDFEPITLGAGSVASTNQSDATNRQSSPAVSAENLLLIYGGRIAAGTSAGYGDVYSTYPGTFVYHGTLFSDPVFNYEVGVEAEVPIRAPLWLDIGASVTRKGRYYQLENTDVSEIDDLWVQERILYLQVPALIRARINLGTGLGVTAAAGLAVNLAAIHGGTYWDYDNNEFDLPSSWWSDRFLRRLAFSAIGRASLELGFGGGLLGIEVGLESHLSRDFRYLDGFGDLVPESSRFRTLNLAAYLRRPLAQL